MTRRTLRKPCVYVGKVSYRDQESALRLGRRVLRDYLASEAGRHHTIAGLWVYRCPDTEHWHLTSKDQRDESRRVKLDQRAVV